MLRKLLTAATLASLAVSAEADSACLMDASAETLVQDLLALPKPERYYSAAEVLRDAVLAEQMQAGSAAKMLDLPIAMASEGETLEAVLPMVLSLAEHDWDGATRQVGGVESHGVMLAAKRLLPLTVQLSGQYQRLGALYPFGKDTYTQNLNMSDAVTTAIEAEHLDLAVSIFASHNFGYHTAMRYDDTMRLLLDVGATEQAQRLTEVVNTGLKDYEAEGGLSLCLERSSLEECQKDIAKRPDMARLESFDQGAFVDCFTLSREKDVIAACLNGIRTRADAEDFDLDADEPVTDGLSGPVYVKLWTYAAAMGNLQPDDVPDAVFRESDFDIMRMHGQVLAALLIQGDDAGVESYLQRILSPDRQHTQSALDRLTSGMEPDLAQVLNWELATALTRKRDVSGLEDMASAPDISEEGRRAAQHGLFEVYRLTGRADNAAELARTIGYEPERLLQKAQWHTAAGETEMAKALSQVVREDICGGQHVLAGDQRRRVIGRFLMARAVQAGQAPLSLLFH